MRREQVTVGLLLCCVVALCIVDNVTCQAMGFESESTSVKFDHTKAVAHGEGFTFTDTKKKTSIDLFKGDHVNEVKPYKPQVLPQLYPTFEIIDPTLLPIELVSDPVPMVNGQQVICALNSQLRHYFDSFQDEANANAIIPPKLKEHNVVLVSETFGKPDAPVNQALQVTYSFPYVKGWLALRTLSDFLVRTFGMTLSNAAVQPKWVKKEEAIFLKQLVDFIETDKGVKNYADNVKFFLFHIYQYLALGSMGNCVLNGYAKLIGGSVLLRTNMYDYINFGGVASVKTILGTNSQATETILSSYQRLIQVVNANRDLPTSKISLCASGSTIYFAKKYYINKNFPVTFNEYITGLWSNGVDLFTTPTNAPEFDNAFGKFKLMLGGEATVIFELRILNGYSYVRNQMNLKDHARKLPTYFHVGREIMTKSSIADMDLTPKVCSRDGLQFVAFDPNQDIPTDDASDLRQDRRLLQGQLHDMREDRRSSSSPETAAPPPRPPSSSSSSSSHSSNSSPTATSESTTTGKPISQPTSTTSKSSSSSSSSKSTSSGTSSPSSSPPKSATPTTAKPPSKGAKTLSVPSKSNDISYLREERRRVRMQKRVDREKRRKTEKVKGLSKVPTEKQKNRETIRLAREKKRLAREEERDAMEGVQPVTFNQLVNMISTQKNKKNKKPSLPPYNKVEVVSHKVTPTKKGKNVNVKLRFYSIPQ